MRKLLLLLALVFGLVGMAKADVFTESDNKVHVNILPTADIHRIPVQVSIDNVVDMTACQFYLTLPEGVDDYLYSEEDEDYVYDKSPRWRSKHSVFIHKGTIYYPNYLYISITSATTQNFKDSSGPIITVYFDGSNVKDGKYDVTVIEPLVIGSDGVNIDTYQAPDTLENFTIEEGKVYPGDTIKACNITFAVDGETISTEKYPVGAAIIFPEMEPRTGYTFSGWEPEDAIASVDTTFNSTYDINKYTVKFVVDNEVYLTQTLDYGSSLTAPEEPKKAGHTFSGWGDLSGIVTKDTTITASFAINSYTINFVIDNDTISSETLEYGAAITLPKVEEKPGYTFSGWGEVSDTVKNDTTYTAHYTINTYVIAFELDGEIIRKDTLEYGSTITVPEVEGRTGYTFSGWGDVAKTAEKDTTYVAQFTINTYTVTYIIDGETYQTVELNYGDEILPPTPEKENYHFAGWGEVEATMPDHNLEYTAHFIAVGDVNADDTINAADIVAIYNFIALSDESGILKKYADVNKDDVINAADVSGVYNIISGTGK